MKKIILAVIALLVVIVCGCYFYFSQIETEYYTISMFPPSWYDNKTKVEVKKVKQYDSDSLAIEVETNLYHSLQQMHNDRVEEAKRKNDHGNEMIFTRFRDEQRCLIKLVHNKRFDFNELKKLIIEHGPNSAQVEQYCEKNGVELSVFPMLSEYF